MISSFGEALEQRLFVGEAKHTYRSWIAVYESIALYDQDRIGRSFEKLSIGFFFIHDMVPVFNVSHAIVFMYNSATQQARKPTSLQKVSDILIQSCNVLNCHNKEHEVSQASE